MQAQEGAPNHPGFPVRCDYAFAKFLIWVSETAEEETYRASLKLVLMYRQSLNAMAYRLPAFQDLDQDDIDDDDLELMSDGSYRDLEFSKDEESEHIPDICNEFVEYWIAKERRPLIFKKQVLIGMTDRMCNWLYTQGFTTSRLIRR